MIRSTTRRTPSSSRSTATGSNRPARSTNARPPPLSRISDHLRVGEQCVEPGRSRRPRGRRPGRPARSRISGGRRWPTGRAGGRAGRRRRPPGRSPAVPGTRPTTGRPSTAATSSRVEGPPGIVHQDRPGRPGEPGVAHGPAQRQIAGTDHHQRCVGHLDRRPGRSPWSRPRPGIERRRRRRRPAGRRPAPPRLPTTASVGAGTGRHRAARQEGETGNDRARPSRRATPSEPTARPPTSRPAPANRPPTAGAEEPRMAGWSPPRSARRVSPRPAADEGQRRRRPRKCRSRLSATRGRGARGDPPSGGGAGTRRRTDQRRGKRTGRGDPGAWGTGRTHGVHGGATELRAPAPMLKSPMEAAFFDLDKTVIAKSSVLAFGRPLYREGLLSRSALLKSAYNQAIYRHAGRRRGAGWSRPATRCSRSPAAGSRPG